MALTRPLTEHACSTVQRGRGAPLEQDVKNLGVLVHEAHARPVRIAVHAEDAPADLRREKGGWNITM